MVRSIVLFTVMTVCMFAAGAQDVGNSHFTGFITRSDNQNVYLTWQVPDSSRLEYFLAEKSSNGVQWQILDTIVYTGNSYQYTDVAPQPGLTYYRIQATENGKIFYSISRRAYLLRIDNSIPVYPNPVSGDLRFNMTALTRGNYQASVYSEDGVRVAGRVINHDGNDKYITIPLPAVISRGVYRLVLQTKNEFYKQIFLVQ